MYLFFTFINPIGYLAFSTGIKLLHVGIWTPYFEQKSLRVSKSSKKIKFSIEKNLLLLNFKEILLLNRK